jgi:Fe-S cluster assembly iron-binding protein IscA
MVVVTDRAAVELQELLKANNASEGQGVRLVPSVNGSIDMTIDSPSDGDEVIRSGEEPILIVDARISGALDGTKIDCDRESVDGSERTLFKLLARSEED